MPLAGGSQSIILHSACRFPLHLENILVEIIFTAQAQIRLGALLVLPSRIRTDLVFRKRGTKSVSFYSLHKCLKDNPSLLFLLAAPCIVKSEWSILVCCRCSAPDCKARRVLSINIMEFIPSSWMVTASTVAESMQYRCNFLAALLSKNKLSIVWCLLQSSWGS